MPANDPINPGGDRRLRAGSLPNGRFSPASTPTGRTFDPSAMNTPQGSENFRDWGESAHSRLSPSESAGYGHSSTDLVDYYAGVSPEMSAAAYKVMHGKSQPQGPHRG